jgi:hypothetical protein
MWRGALSANLPQAVIKLASHPFDLWLHEGLGHRLGLSDDLGHFARVEQIHHGRVGASLSTTLAGWMSDRLGSSVAFLGLACIGAAGLVLTALLMPETMERKAGAAAKRAFSTLD